MDELSELFLFLDVDLDFSFSRDISEAVYSFTSRDVFRPIFRVQTESSAFLIFRRADLDPHDMRHGMALRLVQRFHLQYGPQDVVLWHGYASLVVVESTLYARATFRGNWSYVDGAYASFSITGVRTGVAFQELASRVNDYLPQSVAWAAVGRSEVGAASVSETHPIFAAPGTYTLNYFDSTLLFDGFADFSLNQSFEVLAGLEFGGCFCSNNGAFIFRDRNGLQNNFELFRTVFDVASLSDYELVAVPNRFSYIRGAFFTGIDFVFEELAVISELLISPGRRRYHFEPRVGGELALGSLSDVQFEYDEDLAHNIGMSYVFDDGQHFFEVVSYRPVVVLLPEVVIRGSGAYLSGRLLHEAFTENRGGRTFNLLGTGSREDAVGPIVDLFRRYYSQDTPVASSITIDSSVSGIRAASLDLTNYVQLDGLPEGYLDRYFVSGISRTWSPLSGEVLTQYFLEPWFALTSYDVGGTTAIVGTAEVGL